MLELSDFELSNFDVLNGETLSDDLRHVVARTTVVGLLLADEDLCGRFMEALERAPERQEMILAGKKAIDCLDELAAAAGHDSRGDLLQQQEIELTETKQHLFDDADRAVDSFVDRRSKALLPQLRVACDFVMRELYRRDEGLAGETSNTPWLALDLLRIVYAAETAMVRGHELSESEIEEALPYIRMLDEIEETIEAAMDPGLQPLPDGWANGVTNIGEALQRIWELQSIADFPEVGVLRHDLEEKTEVAARWWFLFMVKGMSINGIATLAKQERIYRSNNPRSNIKAQIASAQKWLSEVPTWRFALVEHGEM